MHRKFIALVLGASLAVASFSAAPARADGDAAKVLAGLAALAIIGAAIEHNKKDQHVTNYYTNPQPAKPHYTKPQYAKPKKIKPRPLPQHVKRKILPQKCLRRHSVNGQKRNLLGRSCMQSHYGYTSSLPYACQLGYWDGRQTRVGFEPQCLRERGFRMVGR